MPIKYNIHNREDGSATVAAYYGGELHVLDNTHTNFQAIVQGCFDIQAAVENGELSLAESLSETVVGLLDVTPQIAEKFRNITERVSVANGRVYFDGDEIHGSLANHLLRCLEEGDEVDWLALANFYENVQQNPNAHSREQLYDWMQRFDFAITLDGRIRCYKGVTEDLLSCTSGPGIVNGEPYADDQLPNNPGDIVEVARSYVTHDPAVGCAQGLHVAAYPYASTFGDATVAVLVNPRDVASVPTECGWEKMRVCRYEVEKVVEAEFTKPYYPPVEVDKEPIVDLTEAQTTASTLDSQAEVVKELLADDELSTKDVIKKLAADYGINTTRHSLRRFRKRYGL